MPIPHLTIKVFPGSNYVNLHITKASEYCNPRCFYDISLTGEQFLNRSFSESEIRIDDLSPDTTYRVSIIFMCDGGVTSDPYEKTFTTNSDPNSDPVPGKCNYLNE